jgi:hypothetical protein
MNVENELNQLIQGTNISFESVKLIYKEIFDIYKKEFKDKSDDEINNLVLSNLTQKIKRIKFSSKAVEFTGMVFGQTSFIDVANLPRYKQIREYAEKVMKENMQLAIAQGLCDVNGNILDTLPTHPTGKPNLNYNKPIPKPGEQIMSKIIGIASYNDKIKPFSMYLRTETVVPLFKPVRFSAIIKKEDPIYELNQSKSTMFLVDENLKMPPVENLVNMFFSDKIIKLSEIYDWHLKHENDKGAFFFAKAKIFEYDYTNDNRPILWLDDLSLNSVPVKCWPPNFMNIDYGVGSEILICASTFLLPTTQNIQTQPGEIPVNLIVKILGIYPIKITNVKIEPNTEQIKKSIEQEIKNVETIPVKELDLIPEEGEI